MSFRGPAEATCKCGWRKTYPSFVAAQFGVDAHQRFGCWYWGKRETPSAVAADTPQSPNQEEFHLTSEGGEHK